MPSFPAFALLLSAALGQPGAPIVQPTVETAAADLAADLRQLIETNAAAQGSVRFTSFEGPAGNGPGANLGKLLTEALTKGGVKVTDTAGFRIGGNIEVTEIDGKLVMVIECEVRNSKGAKVQTLVKRIVMDQVAAAVVAGTSTDLSQATRSVPVEAPAGAPATTPPPVATNPPPGATNPPPVTPPPAATNPPPAVAPPGTGVAPPPATAGPPRSPGEVPLPKTAVAGQVLKSIDQPTATIVEIPVPGQTPREGQPALVRQVVKASDASPYGIEILRRVKTQEFGPGQVTLESAPNGKVTFVQLASTDVFAIRIHNFTKRPVGCALTIDGINVFAFSDVPQWKQLGKMFIGPAGGLVSGWHRTDAVSQEFIITQYADSAAGRFGVKQGVGAITAVFFEVFDANDPTSRGDTPTEGVGLGQEIKAPYQPVVVRFGEPVAVVTVRYNRPDLPLPEGGAVQPGGPGVSPVPPGQPVPPPAPAGQPVPPPPMNPNPAPGVAPVAPPRPAPPPPGAVPPPAPPPPAPAP